MHYKRSWRTGSTKTTKTPKGTALLWMRSVAMAWESEACLIFPFTKISSGYGELTIDGKKVLAHRLACEMANGPAPTAKHDAAHFCRNRSCVNGRHIRWSTRSENMADKIRDDTHDRGTRHWNAILKEEDVIAIRSASGSYQEIAKSFGISDATVWDIKNLRRWAWL